MRAVLRRAITALGLGLLGCSGPSASDAPGSGSRIEIPPALLSQVVFEGYQGADRDLEVHAQRAQLDPRSRVAHLEAVEIRMRDPQRGPLRVTSSRGEFDLSRDEFVLRGDVVGKPGPHAEFRTDELRYVEAEGRLETDTPVELTRPDMHLRADSMQMDLRSQRVRLRGRVVARLRGG